ncbi:hypothetical protein PAESOLCIP111_02400 [Paenibacillus solanacearum]|uniref:Uncharacterized protein n=1 Tax=Paenibacillus solanacearum TaxID=2048548 RepID=A0A916NII9_9BACL|nr:hypothetical protein PAESOLCIP111_02400 [Paenibacillus solanacearum]
MTDLYTIVDQFGGPLQRQAVPEKNLPQRHIEEDLLIGHAADQCSPDGSPQPSFKKSEGLQPVVFLNSLLK